MGVEQKYIKVNEVFFIQGFFDSLSELDTRVSLKIAKYIDETIHELPENKLTSTILGGILTNHKPEPITFAIEIIQKHKNTPILSDIKLISMDEYLDLYNLNLKIESNGSTKSRRNKKHS